MKKIGEIISFDTHWETLNGKRRGTIIGYDLCFSEYKVAVYAFDDKPTSVTKWVFPLTKSTAENKVEI